MHRSKNSILFNNFVGAGIVGSAGYVPPSRTLNIGILLLDFVAYR